MAQHKIRVGIIGANVNRGWGTTAHIPAILALPEYELTAVCTAHPETAAESARYFGARLAFHDHREMARHPDIDLVAVVVRTPFHHELTMDALRAGKHVYTEWPLGATLAEAQEMADLARRQGVKTMVGLQGRCNPAYLYLRELVQEGYVGDVLACHLSQFGAGGLDRTSDRLWAKDRSAGVGTLPITFGHTIDAFCHCVGDFAEVTSVVSTLLPQWYITDTDTAVDVTTPDNVIVTGRLANGAVVSAHVASIPWLGSGLRVQIFGREGTLVYEAPGRLQGGRRGERALQDLPVPERLAQAPETVPQGPPFNVAQMYRRLAESIRTGQRVEPDFDTALQRHRLLDAIQRSSDEGRRVAVPSPSTGEGDPP